jgi:hypothetical protein
MPTPENRMPPILHSHIYGITRGSPYNICDYEYRSDSFDHIKTETIISGISFEIISQIRLTMEMHHRLYCIKCTTAILDSMGNVTHEDFNSGSMSQPL